MRRPVYLLLTFIALGLIAASCNDAAKSPNDTEIISAIDAKLYQNSDLKNLSLNVSSKDGVVTLAGAVNAPLEKLAVEDIATKTAGVRQVVDQLTVESPQPPQAASEAAAQAPAEARSAASARRAHRAHNRQIAEAQPQSSSEPRDSAAPTPDATPAPSAQPAPPAQPAAPPPPPPPVQVTIPAGSSVSVRLIDSISSATAQPGQTYSASLAAPLVANGRVVIPGGADAKVRVVAAQSAGHYQGRSELKLELVSVSYNGTDYPLQTSYFMKQGASRGKNTAEKVGGGAALGALIGGLIGHGKGAGIGAAIGGAAGTADQTATHGQQVTLLSESQVDFTLKSPLTVTLNPSN